jgi:hypothetical protein
VSLPGQFLTVSNCNAARGDRAIASMFGSIVAIEHARSMTWMRSLEGDGVRQTNRRRSVANAAGRLIAQPMRYRAKTPRLNGLSALALR